MNQLNIRDLVIDAEATLGKHPLLTGVKNVYEYKGDIRTDKVIGYKYELALPDHNLDKIDVKILGEKQLEKDEEAGFSEVKLVGLTMGLYRSDKGGYNIYCNADGIELVKKGD